MIFWRILNNNLHPVQEVNRLGFEEDEGLRIPDDYLEAKEFIVMRTCFGLGDWGIISAMPRLLKEKYPNCKVYLPSKNLLKKLFGGMQDNWPTFTNPFNTVHDIFKNNPYIDGFKDEISGEIFHDHYRVYNKNDESIPLIKQMLRFWQFGEDEYLDCTPELYFTNEEKKLGDKIIKEHVGDSEFGGLLITNRFESKGGRYDEEGNKLIATHLLKKYKDLPFFYWTYKPKTQLPLSFKDCLDMRHIDTRIQLYIRSKAKINIGTHCGFLDCLPRYTKVYQIQRVFPLNHNNVEKNYYVNRENYERV
tara:strand:- start:1651 stop:2565 length:915 start_codon:yes stop_codon:yes gene_type:complete